MSMKSVLHHWAGAYSCTSRNASRWHKLQPAPLLTHKHPRVWTNVQLRIVRIHVWSQPTLARNGSKRLSVTIEQNRTQHRRLRYSIDDVTFRGWCLGDGDGLFASGQVGFELIQRHPTNTYLIMQALEQDIIVHSIECRRLVQKDEDHCLLLVYSRQEIIGDSNQNSVRCCEPDGMLTAYAPIADCLESASADGQRQPSPHILRCTGD